MSKYKKLAKKSKKTAIFFMYLQLDGGHTDLINDYFHATHEARSYSCTKQIVDHHLRTRKSTGVFFTFSLCQKTAVKMAVS